MATKKTNSKDTKKTSTKKEEQAAKETKETKNAEEMSVDELTNMFIQNDTQTMARLKEENMAVPVVENTNEPEHEKENTLEKLLGEVVAEQPKETPKPKNDVKQETKPVEEKKPEPLNPTQTPKQPNTNRTVYGYDHFGIIYGY